MIAGGILLFLIAIDMLFARPTGAKRTEAEEREAAQTENPAVFPLAVPMIAGPGTIATVLLLVNLSRGDRSISWSSCLHTRSRSPLRGSACAAPRFCSK